MPIYLTSNFEFRALYILYLSLADDVQLICRKRPNIDNNNLKINFGNLLYIQSDNVKRNI